PSTLEPTPTTTPTEDFSFSDKAKIIPFLITTGTLLFFVFWIGGLAYKYHLETEERRKLQEVDIKAKARELNDFKTNINFNCSWLYFYICSL
ncbi:hypothetical protein ACMUE1_00380, partial [Candidatus Phytoplasma asteris]